MALYLGVGYFEIGLLFDFAVLIIYLLLRRPRRVQRSPHPYAVFIGVAGWVLSLVIYARFTTYYGGVWVLRAVDWMEGYTLLPLLLVVRKSEHGRSDKERT